MSDPAPKSEGPSTRALLKEIWPEARWLVYGWLVLMVCAGVWIYGVVDLFLKHKIVEAAAALIVIPIGFLYGLFRLLGWW
jgi:hypothetical protein